MHPVLSYTTRHLQLGLTLSVSLSVIVGIVVASLRWHIDIGHMTSDVVQLGGLGSFSGAVSQLGLFGWCTAAAVCGFAAACLSRRTSKVEFSFLVCSALLSTYLLLDDAFLLHERFSESALFPLLAVAVLTYLFWFRRNILSTKYGYLVAAIGFLGLSLGIDVVRGHFYDFAVLQQQVDWDSWEHLCEDGPKWMGIVFWCSYFVHTSYALLQKSSQGISEE